VGQVANLRPIGNRPAQAFNNHPENEHLHAAKNLAASRTPSERSAFFEIVKTDLPGLHASAVEALRRWDLFKLP
jgi:hypothetical protein